MGRDVAESKYQRGFETTILSGSRFSGAVMCRRRGIGRGEFRWRTLHQGNPNRKRSFGSTGIRQGGTRFDAAVIRGLNSFVGREHELELLERGNTEARSELRVIDISAEPGRSFGQATASVCVTCGR
jgi:hypothetical protein